MKPNIMKRTQIYPHRRMDRTKIYPVNPVILSKIILQLEVKE